ncbi:MAG: hypothetical protein RIC55_22875 [Pirellulaceae bacterium]
MNRTELQSLSEQRVEDAGILLAAKRWPAAYYMAGYALECALKACVLVYIERTGIIFEDKKFSQNCWTHDIEELVRLAGLRIDRDRVAGANASLGQNWLTARDWSESSRYRMSTQSQAETLLSALIDDPDEVLPWVKNYW